MRFAGRSTIQGVVQDYPPLKKAGLADSLADWETTAPLGGAASAPTTGSRRCSWRYGWPTRPAPGTSTASVLPRRRGDTIR